MRTETLSPLDLDTDELFRNHEAVDRSWKNDRDPRGNEANENNERGENHAFEDSQAGEQDKKLSPEEAMIEQGRAKAVEEMGGEAHEWEVGAHCNFNAAVIREGKMYEGGKESAEIAEEHGNLEDHELMLAHLLDYPDEGYRGREYMEVTPDGTICHVSIAFVDSRGNVSHVHLFRNMLEDARSFEDGGSDTEESSETENDEETIKDFVQEESEEYGPISEVQSEDANSVMKLFSEMFRIETPENNAEQIDTPESELAEDAVTVEQIHVAGEQKHELVMMEVVEDASEVSLADEQANEAVDMGTTSGSESPEVVSEISEDLSGHVGSELIEDVLPAQETDSQANEIPTTILTPVSKEVDSSLLKAPMHKDIGEVTVPVINHESTKVVEDVVIPSLDEEPLVQEVQITDTEVAITESAATTVVEASESSAIGMEYSTSELEEIAKVENTYLGNESLPEAQIEQQDNPINETQEEVIAEPGKETTAQEEPETSDNEKHEDGSTQPQQIELHDTLRELFAADILNDNLEIAKESPPLQENNRRESLAGVEKAPVSPDVQERNVVGEAALPSEVARLLGRGVNVRSAATSRFAANDNDSRNNPRAQIVTRNGIRMERAIAA